ncbi:MAG: DUF502 domain-containing protein [Rubrivivax sp.]|jgi:uncharacterized membrane protein|nr:DUF502 domain-containing protein [Rubrivivax sp.]MCA3259463.1 DUF502 domain-containing protein [Rubrivivax sp.]
MASMKRTTGHLLRIFLAGLLAALPLAATIFIFWWAVGLLIRGLGPNSPVGSVLVRLGLGVTGSEIVGYLFGVGIVLALIFGLGLLVEAGLQRGVARIFEGVLRRIPVVGTVYDLAHKMVGLFAQRDEDGLRSMSPVWCHFGGRGGAVALALLSTPQPVRLGNKAYLALIVPTAPVPVGGGLLYVPEDWVEPADVGVEALTSIYVSLGVTSPQHLPAAAPPAPQSPARNDA